MIQKNVNGKKQDVIITNSFKNSEFEKIEKKLHYSVLEYLFIKIYLFVLPFPLDLASCATRKPTQPYALI